MLGTQRAKQTGKRLFTDGSCEPIPWKSFGVSAGYGAVMLDLQSSNCEFFGATVGDDLLELLTEGGLPPVSFGRKTSDTALSFTSLTMTLRALQ